MRGWRSELPAAARQLTHADPFNNHPLDIIDGLLKKRLIAQRRAGYRLNLSGEIGVMLCGRPDHKDQMLRVNRRQPAALDQAGNNRRLFIHQRFQIAGQFTHQQRRALQHLQAEQP